MPFISASAISPYNVNSNLVGEKAFTFGNALKLTSGTEFVDFSSGLAALNNSPKASFHFWVKHSVDKIASVGNYLSSTNNFGIYIATNNNIYFHASNGSLIQILSTFIPYLDQWTLVSNVFDGTQNKMTGYINGVQVVQSLSAPNTLSSIAGSDFAINILPNSGVNGVSIYDEVLISLDASTPSEILSYYNSGNGKHPSDCFTNILSYWNMNQVDGDTTLIDSVGTATGTLNNFVAPYFITH